MLKPLNARTDRRRLRRPLTEEELRSLIEAAERGLAVQGIPGPTRTLLYVLAVETGLRRNELRSLRVVDFEGLEGEAPRVRLPAGASKHRKEDVLPLLPETARAIAGFLRGRGALQRAFDLPGGWKSAEMLRADLAAADIPYRDESGHAFDFHCFRGMTATRSLAAGANPRAVQALMRHAKPDLILSIYARLRPGEDRAALDLLPRLIPSSLEHATSTGKDAASYGALGLRKGEEAGGCKRASSGAGREETRYRSEGSSGSGR